MTHAELVLIAGRWLRGTAGCSVALTELVCATSYGEQPDAVGWKSADSLLIECKASRADFIADKKKKFRLNPYIGIGKYRYFMSPKNMIRCEELPAKWGLLEVDKGRVYRKCGHEPGSFGDREEWQHVMRSREDEIRMLISAMTRIRTGLPSDQFNSLLHTRLMR